MGSETFGGRLRAQRERAGVSLDAISQSTKIQRTLLEALENNDVSHWPLGIFRRAFFRDYLAAIGLQSEALVAEFVQLFPEPGEAVPVVLGRPAAPRRTALPGHAVVPGHAVAPEEPAAGTGELRLQLAPVRFSAARRLLLQFVAAVVDLAAVVVGSAWGVVLFKVPVWPALAATTVGYYALSAALLGKSPALWLFFNSHQLFRRRAQASAEAPTLRLVSRQPEAIGGDASDDVEGLEQRRAM